MVEYTDLNNTEVLAEAGANAKLVVEEDGELKRIPASAVGQVKTVNGVEPDESGNVDVSGLPEGVPVIQTATVGQTVAVKAVDESGKPTEWEAVDKFSGSWNDLSDKPFYANEISAVEVPARTIEFAEVQAGLGSATVTIAEMSSDVQTQLLSRKGYCTVKWDDVTYENLPIEFYQAGFLAGNWSLGGMSTDDTGEPFLLLITGTTLNILTNDVTAHEVAVDVWYMDIKPIPSYMLPDSIVIYESSNNKFSATISFEEAWALPPNVLLQRLVCCYDYGSTASVDNSQSAVSVNKGYSSGILGSDETVKHILARFEYMDTGFDGTAPIAVLSTVSVLWTADGITLYRG